MMTNTPQSYSPLFRPISPSPHLPVSLLFQRPNLQMRTHLRRMVEPVRGFLKIGFGGLVNVHELLRVTINQWEPTALNLNHDFVARLERVKNVVQSYLDFLRLAGRERFGV